MQCVLNLVFQYFVIYLLLWVYYTVEDFVGLDMSILAAAKDAIESAKVPSVWNCTNFDRAELQSGMSK